MSVPSLVCPVPPPPLPKLCHHARTVTLVEGATDAHFFQSLPTDFPGVTGTYVLHEDCGISGDSVVCTDVHSMATATKTFTQTNAVTAFKVAVQVASAVSTTSSATHSNGGKAATSLFVASVFVILGAVANFV